MNLTLQFITEDLLAEVLNTFDWSVPFTLEYEMPDGINVAFPNSNFYFVDMEGRISVQFLPEDTKEPIMPFTIQDAIEVLAPEVDTRGYDFFHISGVPSLEKAKVGIERCSALIYHNLLAVVNGDFSWVPEAKGRRISI